MKVAVSRGIASRFFTFLMIQAFPQHSEWCIWSDIDAGTHLAYYLVRRVITHRGGLKTRGTCRALSENFLNTAAYLKVETFHIPQMSKSVDFDATLPIRFPKGGNLFRGCSVMFCKRIRCLNMIVSLWIVRDRIRPDIRFLTIFEIGTHQTSSGIGSV
jgi:hypothetical protein